jgi:hypothetical protein
MRTIITSIILWAYPLAALVISAGIYSLVPIGVSLVISGGLFARSRFSLNPITLTGAKNIWGNG